MNSNCEPTTAATAAMAQAYIHVNVIRENYEYFIVNAGKPPSRRTMGKVQAGLAFLQRSGHSEVEAAYVDCTRCLLYALDVLHGAPDEFTQVYQGYWIACGALTGEVLSRRTPVRVDPAVRLNWFRERYEQENTPWSTRVNIIASFAELVARKETPRNTTFWEVINRFLELCRDALDANVRELPAIRPAIGALQNLWWNLAKCLGTYMDVRLAVAKAAIPLLELHIKSGVNHNNIARWQEALRKLELGLCDLLKKEALTADRDPTTQKALDAIAKRLDELSKRTGSASLEPWMSEVRESLVHYLHGRVRRDPRIVPEDFVKCTARFNSSNAGVIEAKISLRNICPRTGAGFCITTEDFRVRGVHEGEDGHNGTTVDDRPCRTVNSTHPTHGVCTIDAVLLEVPYAIGSARATIPFECRILRAWESGVDGSGWAVVAPQATASEPSWQAYLRLRESVGMR